MNNEKKIVLQGEFEDVIEFNNHYYIKSKKDKVCVLPYTIDNGLLDLIGAVKIWNSEEMEDSYTLISDYLSQDDGTDMVGANRILYDIIGSNITDASRWMYLGSLFNSLTSDSPIKVYCVNVSYMEIKEDILNIKNNKSFKFIKSSVVTQTDDLLFLGAFNRLFNFFVKSSL